MDNRLAESKGTSDAAHLSSSAHGAAASAHPNEQPGDIDRLQLEDRLRLRSVDNLSSKTRLIAQDVFLSQEENSKHDQCIEMQSSSVEYNTTTHGSIIKSPDDNSDELVESGIEVLDNNTKEIGVNIHVTDNIDLSNGTIELAHGNLVAAEGNIKLSDDHTLPNGEINKITDNHIDPPPEGNIHFVEGNMKKSADKMELSDVSSEGNVADENDLTSPGHIGQPAHADDIELMTESRYVLIERSSTTVGIAEDQVHEYPEEGGAENRQSLYLNQYPVQVPE